METIILDANNSDNITLCASILRDAGLVAFPTETVYGLGADALEENAIAKIFSVKGRQEDNPLIVHVASIDDVKPLVKNIPEIFEPLVKQYWPGPLTLIMEKSSIIPNNVTAGLDTIAIRMPEHPAALALISAFGRPVAAPSANPSGMPSPTRALHVLHDLDGKIPYILDGGDCRVGVESTVLDITNKIPKILRPGSVTYDELRYVLVDVDIIGTEVVDKPSSPGMKYRHYAPKAPLIAVIGSPDETAEYIASRLGDDVAALMFDDYSLSHSNVVSYGDSEDFLTQASCLFDALRKLDNMGMSAIYTQLPQEIGLGATIANRLKKAAGNNIINLKD